MIKKALFLLLALCLTTGVSAQEEVTVKTFKELIDGMWSVALNLNSTIKDPIDIYIDDISWKVKNVASGR